MKFNKNHAGLALGSLTALGHLFWLVLVAIGLAKPLLDFVLSLHHFEMQYVISSFDVVKVDRPSHPDLRRGICPRLGPCGYLEQVPEIVSSADNAA